MVEKKGRQPAKKSEAGPEDVNVLVSRFQITQQQLQNVLLQKETLTLNKAEIDRAMEELEKMSDKTAYKITGNIMISKPVDELKKELENTKEAIEIRMKSLEKMEKRLTEQLKEMQEKLKDIIK